MQVKPSSVLRRSFRVSHDLPEEDRVAFFDDARSELVIVNSLGGAIWHLLDGQLSVRAIAEILSQEVQSAPGVDDVEAQVQSYLQILLDRQAVELVD
jgi:hypothetical protein